MGGGIDDDALADAAAKLTASPDLGDAPPIRSSLAFLPCLGVSPLSAWLNSGNNGVATKRFLLLPSDIISILQYSFLCLLMAKRPRHGGGSCQAQCGRAPPELIAKV